MSLSNSEEVSVHSVVEEIPEDLKTVRREIAVESTRLSMMGGAQWGEERLGESRVYLFFKRTFDIIVSLVAIILTLPAMLIVAIAVKLESKGPLIFKQLRSGKMNKPFMMLKFRSMVVDSEEKKGSLMAMNEMDGPVFKIKKDPRVTKVGKFIRRWSLDELPQLFNVLIGEMSIVGPRPLPVEEVASLDEDQMGRQAVQPGLTCIWQISGRNDISFEEWIQLDLIYIHNRTFLLDLEIFVRTFSAIIRRSGAS